MAYLLDANVFIAAKNLHYGMDFCPAFWDWLAAEGRRGNVLSIEKVYDELAAAGDGLTTWAKAQGDQFFRQPDATFYPSLAALSAWATVGRYEPAAHSTFLQLADSYLVAQAHAGKHVVVTHEVPSPSTRKIKVPDACIGLGVKCMSPYAMLRHEGAKFVLGVPK